MYTHPQREDKSYRGLLTRANDLAEHTLSQEDWGKSKDNRAARNLYRIFNTDRLIACFQEARDEYPECGRLREDQFLRNAKKLRNDRMIKNTSGNTNNTGS